MSEAEQLEELRRILELVKTRDFKTLQKIGYAFYDYPHKPPDAGQATGDH